MSNDNDDKRRSRDRPEDNPFIAFRRFADSQVSSLLNTVFTLPATIANHNNIHQAREACLFNKADKAQCDKLREIEDDIAELRHEGRELYRVGDLQEVLKKSQELMRLDRHADDLRKNIVDQSSHSSSSENDKDLVQRFANRKGQEWGWDWSWGFPKPFDEDSHEDRPTTNGRYETSSSHEQQRAVYEQMMADARSIFGEDALDQTIDTVVDTIARYPALRSVIDQMASKEFYDALDKDLARRGDEAEGCRRTERGNSNIWMLLQGESSSSNRYSPHILDQDEEMKKTGVNWRAAYEDLLRVDNKDSEGMICPMRSRGMYPKRVPWADEETNDEPSYEYSHDHEDQHDDPPTPKVRQGGFAQSESRRPGACLAESDDSDINKFIQEQEEKGRYLALRGPTTACKEAWADEDIHKYLQEQREQNGRHLSLRESVQPVDDNDDAAETELDAYEHLLKPKATHSTPPTATNTSNDMPLSILSTLTTTERTVAPDGSVTTKVVLKKRFVDGREESSETVHTHRGQEQDQMRGPSAAAQKSFAPHGGKKAEEQKEEKKKGGWFWSS